MGLDDVGADEPPREGSLVNYPDKLWQNVSMKRLIVTRPKRRDNGMAGWGDEQDVGTVS